MEEFVIYVYSIITPFTHTPSPNDIFLIASIDLDTQSTVFLKMTNKIKWIIYTAEITIDIPFEQNLMVTPDLRRQDNSFFFFIFLYENTMTSH